MQGKAGRLLRKTREERGLTLKDVTMRTGIEQSLLSRWERGLVTKISADSLLLVTRELGLKLEDVVDLLIEDEDTKRDEAAARDGAAGDGAGPARATR